MIDSINPKDKVVVVAVMIEEDMLVDIIAHVMCAFCVKSFSKFNTITGIPARVGKIEIIYSFFAERSSRKMIL